MTGFIMSDRHVYAFEPGVLFLVACTRWMWIHGHGIGGGEDCGRQGARTWLLAVFVLLESLDIDDTNPGRPHCGVVEQVRMSRKSPSCVRLAISWSNSVVGFLHGGVGRRARRDYGSTRFCSDIAWVEVEHAAELGFIVGTKIGR